MEIFRLGRQILRFTTFYPKPNESVQFKLFSWLILLLLIIGLQCVAWLSLLLAFELMTDEKMWDKELMTYAVMQVVPPTSAFCSIAYFLLHKSGIRNCIDKTQRIFSQRAADRSAYDYVRTENRVDFVCWFYFAFFFVPSTIIFVGANIGLICFDYYFHDRIAYEKLYYNLHFYGFVNRRDDFSGFILNTAMIEFTMIGYYGISQIVVFLFLGPFLYLRAFCEDMRLMFDGIRIRQENARLVVAIEFHSQIIELFVQYRDLVSGLVFFQLAFGAVFVALTFTQFEFVLTAASSTTMIFGALLSISSILPFCYIGSLITETLASVGHSAYRSDWHKLPVPRRQYIRVIIMYAQQSRRIDGFGLITCDLPTFSTIIKTALTYLLMLREL